MNRTLFSLLLPVFIGMVMAGCTSSTDSETAYIEDFGDLTADKEAPAFGDPDLEEMVDVEQAISDPVAFSPAVDSIENQDRTDRFCFRMLWGNLERDSGITELTDWSGSLTLTRGAILVTHTIRFEPGQDYLLPRYNEQGYYIPEELRWVSKTSVHLDGIATRLLIPPSVTDDIVTVTYESPQLTISFEINDLESLDTLITIGEGNAIAFHATRCEPPTVRPTRGHLVGRWGRDDAGQGIFYGRWMTANGRVIGTVRGTWGVDTTGARVFVGKYIDNDGNFEGFVKGVWRDRGQGANACGQFRGRIFNADREPIGVLMGHFKKGDTRRGGWFAGLWYVGGGCFSPRW